MNYQVVEYQKYNKEIFFEYLKQEYQNSRDIAKENMWNVNWVDKPNTLPFLLERSDRFCPPKGQFYILTLDKNVIGCGGVYRSDFNPYVGLCGTRLYITSKFRNQSIFRDTIFPLHKKWCIENDCKIAALCFNEYNKNLIKTFTRKRLGEKLNRLSTRLPKHLFYNGIEEVLFPVKIQNTKQYVIYEKLDETFNFDWKSIRY